MTFMAVLLALVVVLALAVGVWALRRGRKTGEVALFHFRCADCGRRLRYREEQVGHRGQCSNCGRELVFPPTSESID